MSVAVPTKLSRQEREAVLAWLAEHEATLPSAVRALLAEPLAKLTGEHVAPREFDRYSRQLARAMGLIPSSERRRPSGRPLAGEKRGAVGRVSSERERLEREREHLQARRTRTRDQLHANATAMATLTEHEEHDPMSDPSPHQSQPTQADCATQVTTDDEQDSVEFLARLDAGGGLDPALGSASEALMNAACVCTDEDHVVVPAPLPEDVSEEDVERTWLEPRTRYDFAVTVTEVHLDVEKKVVMSADGQRQVISGNVHAHGPRGFAVTWSAMATLAVLIGQFAMPLNRLGTMLSSATKKFTSTSLSRMAHYVAKRFVPVYLVLMEQLADSDILAGDDTSCRVVEVSSHFAKSERNPHQAPPWAPYRNVDAAQNSYIESLRRKLELLARRAEGEREARQAPAHDPPLKVLVGRELNFESERRQGGGTKRSLNTTVLTGRTEADDPRSLVVFYRSHLGSLGNLLEMLLSRRKPAARKLIVQADLSTANLVTDPELCSRFEIELVGCSAHARRPFAQYQDHDPEYTRIVLETFSALAFHESALDQVGRNHENALAVRQTDSRPCWELIKQACEQMVRKWTKATPLGTAARYILRHFDKLTAHLSDPRLEPTNNLRERMLRTEKLIEKSSLFRRSIEGRVVLDILRTILQTAVAAGAPPHEYLVSVMKADPDDIDERPEHYTPRAWAKRHQAQTQAETTLRASA